MFANLNTEWHRNVDLNAGTAVIIGRGIELAPDDERTLIAIAYTNGLRGTYAQS